MTEHQETMQGNDYRFVIRKEQLIAFRDKEINYFEPIVKIHIDEQDHFLEDLKNSINNLLDIINDKKDEENKDAFECWNDFLKLKDRFYNYILDKSFNMIKWGREEDNKKVDCSLQKKESIYVLTLEKIIKEGLRFDWIRTHKYMSKETNQATYYRLPVRYYEEASNDLMDYLLRDEKKDGHKKIKNIMKFDRSLAGNLLYSRIAFDKTCWLRNITDSIFRRNTNLGLPKDIILVSIDDTDNSYEETNNKQEELLKKISDSIDKLNNSDQRPPWDFPKKTDNLGNEYENDLKSGKALIYSYLFFQSNNLLKTNRLLYEQFLLRKGVASFEENNQGMSAKDIKKILACLTQDEECQNEQEAVLIENQKVWANSNILDWSDSDMSRNMKKIKKIFYRLNVYLVQYLGEDKDSRFSEFYAYLRRKVNTTTIDSKLFSEDGLYDNFISFINDNSDIKEILLEKANINQINMCIKHYVINLRMIHDYFNQTDECVVLKRVKSNNCCFICTKIEDVPGLEYDVKNWSRLFD